MYNMVSDKIQDIPNMNVSEAVNARPNIPLNIKFKCDMCDASFKKKNMTLKNNKTICSPKKKIAKKSLFLRLMS